MRGFFAWLDGWWIWSANVSYRSEAFVMWYMVWLLGGLLRRCWICETDCFFRLRWYVHGPRVGKSRLSSSSSLLSSFVLGKRKRFHRGHGRGMI